MSEEKDKRLTDLETKLKILRLKFINKLDQSIGEEKRILKKYIRIIDNFLDPKSG